MDDDVEATADDGANGGGIEGDQPVHCGKYEGNGSSVDLLIEAHHALRRDVLPGEVERAS